MRRHAALPTFADQPFLALPESVGHYERLSDHSVFRQAGTLNNCNIHYVAEGVGYAEVDGEVHTLRRGDAILYFPMQRQRYYTDKVDPWDVRWVHFYGHGLQEYTVGLNLHRTNVWTLRQSDSFERAHLELLAEAESWQLLDRARLSALTYAVLAEFIQHAVPQEPPDRSRDAAKRVLALLPIMQKEAGQPFELSRWAEAAGVSDAYFFKLFRRAMGLTPLAFVVECRMRLAKQMLLERRDESVRSIAEQSGYPSASYFNKVFAEREGMTPTAYRALHTAGGGSIEL